jgi:hypothetical protein
MDPSGATNALPIVVGLILRMSSSHSILNSEIEWFMRGYMFRCRFSRRSFGPGGDLRATESCARGSSQPRPQLDVRRVGRSRLGIQASESDQEGWLRDRLADPARPVGEDHDEPPDQETIGLSAGSIVHGAVH